MTGILPITKTSTMFKYLFCEIAKIIKQSGHQKQQEACIPSQIFYMDLSYVSDPSNLDDIILHNAPPDPTIQ